MAYLSEENKRKQRQRNSFTGFSYSYGYPGLPADEKKELERISADAYRKREKAEKYQNLADECWERREWENAKKYRLAARHLMEEARRDAAKARGLSDRYYEKLAKERRKRKFRTDHNILFVIISHIRKRLFRGRDV